METHSAADISPPLAESGVFFASGSSLIDAPRKIIWDIMLDFPQYGKWNTFIRRVTLSPPYPHPYSVTSPPPHPVVGAHISVLVRMPPDLSEPTLLTRGDAFARITMLDKVNYRAVFEMAGLPRWFLHSERWQWLEEVEVEVPIDRGEGSGSVMCKKKMVRYQTIEVFYGLAAYVMNFFMGSKLKVGFQAAAGALKHRA